jgi:hypothetical protein
MMSATAMMEARSSGQIGHPAAWMMANTRLATLLAAKSETLAVSPGFGKAREGRREAATAHGSLSTVAVDKVVNDVGRHAVSEVPARLFYRLMNF